MRPLALLLVLAACGAGCGGGREEADRGPVPREVVGAVASVAEEDGDVVAFRLATGGEAYTIRIDPTHDYGFDLAHLHDHWNLAEPVRVRTREAGGVTYALLIDDA